MKSEKELIKVLNEIWEDRVDSDNRRVILPESDWNTLKIHEWVNEDGNLYQAFKFGTFYTGIGGLINFIKMFSEKFDGDLIYPFRKTMYNGKELPIGEIERFFEHVKSVIKDEEE